MTPRGRRTSRRVASSSLFVVLGVVAAACNMLTGAGDLMPCEGATCENLSLTSDGSVTTVDGTSTSDAASHDRASIVQGDDAADGPTIEAGGEGGSSCPLCDGGSCCAPNVCVVATGICGACSKASGPCQVDSDCCDGLKCNSRGECASSCIPQNQQCSLGACCLGSRCSFLAALTCTPCSLHGTSCSNNGGCCSNSCVNGACVGNVPPSPGPGN